MYFNWNENINTKELEKVSNDLKKGALVVFPTETVYGIGANAFDADAVNKIFVAKGRPNDNPLIVHVFSYEQILEIAENISEIEEKIIRAFMPGPITIILNKKAIIPECVSAGLDTIGVRMPDCEIARKIIETSGVPVAAPSANISGKPSGTTIEDIKKELEEKVDYIIDGGRTQIGLESTVIKVIDGIPTILRPGAITPDDIKKVVSKCEIDSKVFEIVKKDEKVESPGMKYRHYAPKTKCRLIYSSDSCKLINEINSQINEFKNDVVILGFEDHFKDFKISDNRFINLGNSKDYKNIASNIFSALRKADEYNAKLVLIEGVKREGIGIAIMNRLLRTCEYDYIEI